MQASEASPAANAALRARLSELLDDYDRVRRDLGDAQARMKEMRGTARSADGTVVVTVDFRGTLTALEIGPRAYSRFAPSLLAEEILRLTAAARADVTGAMGEVMAPFLPQGLEYGALMDGSADMGRLSVPAPLDDEGYDAWRARFSGVRDASAAGDGGSGDGSGFGTGSGGGAGAGYGAGHGSGYGSGSAR
ncbi:MAG: YbaB/EbfC family nucleoid-associated protein [Catenulispora sp.]|nr:YbaB/EbfC family nucleoid-associated protein [Catenulispora sp.]